mmetsp:Transcript_12884/g.47113  ORF Transcript_12884/g.47113 Transcript_12884/m.47113 type:complete len:235 (-) Transcript_12884:1396-2100(-)
MSCSSNWPILSMPVLTPMASTKSSTRARISSLSRSVNTTATLPSMRVTIPLTPSCDPDVTFTWSPIVKNFCKCAAGKSRGSWSSSCCGRIVTISSVTFSTVPVRFSRSPCFTTTTSPIPNMLFLDPSRAADNISRDCCLLAPSSPSVNLCSSSKDGAGSGLMVTRDICLCKKPSRKIKFASAISSYLPCSSSLSMTILSPISAGNSALENKRAAGLCLPFFSGSSSWNTFATIA